MYTHFQLQIRPKNTSTHSSGHTGDDGNICSLRIRILDIHVSPAAGRHVSWRHHGHRLCDCHGIRRHPVSRCYFSSLSSAIQFRPYTSTRLRLLLQGLLQFSTSNLNTCDSTPYLFLLNPGNSTLVDSGQKNWRGCQDFRTRGNYVSTTIRCHYDELQAVEYPCLNILFV